jgi:glycosyltransferase involved in cell wall biosynthesis
LYSGKAANLLGDKPLKDHKILFAPHEIGGQMQLMTEELRRRGYFATAATYTQEWFGHVNDIHLNLDSKKGKLKKQFLALLFSLWAAANYDVFHFFWGSSLYGLNGLPHLDLPFLHRLGKKIFVHFRGIEIIDIAYFDYLRSRTAGDVVSEPPMSRPEQVRSLNKWRRYAHKMLVSEPDLFRVVPDAVMVQQAIDLDYWICAKRSPSSRDGSIIRIAHAPSMRRKKGTEFVLKSFGELKNMGWPVELILIEKVPFSEVKRLYEICDIGVDQVLYGWYGKVSIELMAMAKPVICYIDPDLLAYRRDMPIVSANPRDLTEKLKMLVENAQLRKEIGAQGLEYAKKYHDVRVIVDQCLRIYEESY